MYHIHPVLKEIGAIFSRAGCSVFLVGGAVRDMVRGKDAHDWDLATNADPEEVSKLFHEVIPTGIKHGTVTVLFRGYSIEVTTFRTESGYADGRHPDSVKYAATIEEDLSRRDFTMNALALELPGARLVDPFAGQKDIKDKVIRCVGSPQERFSEDGLRILRALRFAAQLGFTIESGTMAAIPASVPMISKVSEERIRDEFDKMLESNRPSDAFIPMEKAGLLERILPELARCRGVEQKGFHRFDVLDHSLLACDYAARNHYPHTVRLAALFHDIGKPDTRQLDESGKWTFYRHEKISADLTRAILTRFRYSNAVIEEVVHLIAEHMFHYEEQWRTASVRRFIVRVGVQHLPALYQLRRADTFGTAGVEAPPDSLEPLMSRVDSVLAQQNCLSLKDLAINGRDIIALGIPPGPRVGMVLQELFETTLEDPDQNTPEQLKTIAQNIIKRWEEE
ncbi:HDIG domain-containing protein [Spirochaetia bacterium]|nr:HDIG domain-containing protein [Spirochaetia bacterium]GHU29802.1 HDIG domain-containing protein [Spirochaetia bacterium]